MSYYYYITMLRYQPLYRSKKPLFLKTVNALKLSLISTEIFYKSKGKVHFHNQKRLKLL